MKSSRPPVYMDYAATTPVDERVMACMNEALTLQGAFGNPGSMHAYGEQAQALVEGARDRVAAVVGAQPAELIWTSGATESNNLAIFGVAHYYRAKGRHLVTARTEHKSVLDPMRELERRGWQVTYVVPDKDGVVDPIQVANALRPDTVLVSIMHVNNEIGVIQDVDAIARHCRARAVPLHVDAAQSVGKCALDLSAAGIALASFCAHKAYGPKGSGALAISESSEIKIAPLQFGGGQERGRRSGTLATHQVCGMAEAFDLAEQERVAEGVRIGALRDQLWAGISAAGGALRNGDPIRCVPQILNVSFQGVEGESLLAAVSEKIAVSTGSACTSVTAEPSFVLRALGRDEQLAQSSLRFSLGRYSTMDDVVCAVDAVNAAVARLRRIAGG